MLDDQCSDERFLVLAPTGRDAPLTSALLEQSGLASLACASMEELCDHFDAEGAAGLLLAEEVLVPRAIARLSASLVGQASWSDVPIVLFTSSSVPTHSTRISSL